MTKPELWDATLSLYEQRHGTVVHELHIHHCAEFSRLDAQTTGTQGRDEPFVERDCCLGSCRVDEARPPSLLRVPIEGELRNDESRTPYIGEGEVHLVFGVGKETQAAD